MREGTERLLEGPHRLAVGRARQGLLPRLPAVRQGLVPHLPPQGMVRQPFDLLGHPLPSERLKSLDNTRVQYPPPLLEQTTVGHLVGQGVLESKVALGEQPGLVEELGGLQVGQPAVQGLFWQLRNGLEQGKGHLRPNDGGRLEEAFLFQWQPVNARRQYRLHGGWHLDGGEGLRQTVGAWHTNQHARLDQGADTLLQEEGIPRRALDQERLSGSRPGSSPSRAWRSASALAGGSGSSRTCV